MAVITGEKESESCTFGLVLYRTFLKYLLRRPLIMLKIENCVENLSVSSTLFGLTPTFINDC